MLEVLFNARYEKATLLRILTLHRLPLRVGASSMSDKLTNPHESVNTY
jgi:hypothetical protein